MFAVTDKQTSYSPHCMRFSRWWIYDLRHLHSSLQEKILHKASGDFANTPWEALMKAYGLHLFSPLPQLKNFCWDFQTHFKKKVSRKNRDDLFAVFQRLGLQRIGNLKKIEASEIQNRFGKEWFEFFSGVLEPSHTPWPWQPYHERAPHFWSHDFDFPCVDAALIRDGLQLGLESFAAESPSLSLSSLHLSLYLYESAEEIPLSLRFTQPILLQKNISWFLRLFDEQLQTLSLSSPLARMEIKGESQERAKPLQLSLFENKVKAQARVELCQKLLEQNFQIFQPESLPSYLPEKSWAKSSPLQPLCLRSEGQLRPLIQHPPKTIKNIENLPRKYFSERLSWFDDEGKRHQRDYFFAREQRKWIWVFQDERGEWFQQGIVE